MKILSLLVSMLVISQVALADSPQPTALGQAVVDYPVVETIYNLFNLNNQKTCTKPLAKDVKIYCLGALPAVEKPTIAGVGCGFTVKIFCGNKALAVITGRDQSYEIIDQHQQVSDYTSVGLIISDVKITPHHAQ